MTRFIWSLLAMVLAPLGLRIPKVLPWWEQAPLYESGAEIFWSKGVEDDVADQLGVPRIPREEATAEDGWFIPI